MTATNRPAATPSTVRFAWSLSGLCVALGLAQAVLGVAAGQPVRELVGPSANVTAFSIFAVVGASLAASRPRLVIGWLLLVIAFGSVLESYLIQYGRAAPVLGLPLAAVADWLGFVVWFLSMGGIAVLLLVFPDGRLLSARWHGCLVPVAVGVALLVGSGIPAWPLRGQLDGLPDDALPSVLNDLAFGAFAVGVLCGLAALIMRFRRGSNVERTQIAWLAYAVVAMVVFLGVALRLPAELTDGGFVPLDVVAPFAPALLAVAIWIAVTRHGLYELDRIVGRTVTYAIVTGVLVVTYAGSVVALRTVLAPFVGASDLAVAGSTLAVAAMFGPIRRRVQQVVDRRFDRRRYDALAVSRVGQTVRDEVDPQQVATELRAAVAMTIQPASTSLWLPERGVSS